MQAYFITFRSITAAQRGERALKEAGLSPSLQRTPRWMQERGCGYSLRIKADAGERAVAALNQRGIAFGKVYVGGSGGEFKEAAL